MKIFTKSGGIGVGNRFSGFEACCFSMTEALVINRQMSIDMYGFLLLNPTKKVLTYCPFCGERVQHIHVDQELKI